MRRHERTSLSGAVVTALLALTLAGCSDDSETPKDGGKDVATTDMGVVPPPVKLTCQNDCKDFVISKLMLPDSSTAGLDFDGDGVIDNTLGSILGSLSTMGLNVQDAFDRGLYHGDIIVLMRVQAADFADAAKAGAQLWMGASTKCCKEQDTDLCKAEATAKDGCFGGGHTFFPDPKSTDETLLGGAITASQVSLGPGTMKLVLPVAEQTDLVLNLQHFHVKGKLAPGGTSMSGGLLAGVVSRTDLEQSFVPGIKVVLDDTLADPNTPQKDKDLVLNLFDKDKDGKVSLDEVKQNSLIQTILAGDVDLDKDGVKELSLGLTFEAVGATIDTTGTVPDAGTPDLGADVGTPDLGTDAGIGTDAAPTDAAKE